MQAILLGFFLSRTLSPFSVVVNLSSETFPLLVRLFILTPLTLETLTAPGPGWLAHWRHRHGEISFSIWDTFIVCCPILTTFCMIVSLRASSLAPGACMEPRPQRGPQSGLLDSGIALWETNTLLNFKLVRTEWQQHLCFSALIPPYQKNPLISKL